MNQNFSDFEKEVSDNMLNTDFLQNYQSKLYKYLKKIFMLINRCCIVFLIQNIAKLLDINLGKFTLFFYQK